MPAQIGISARPLEASLIRTYDEFKSGILGTIYNFRVWNTAATSTLRCGISVVDALSGPETLTSSV